jgi:hypothetical protein
VVGHLDKGVVIGQGDCVCGLTGREEGALEVLGRF